MKRWKISIYELFYLFVCAYIYIINRDVLEERDEGVVYSTDDLFIISLGLGHTHFRIFSHFQSTFCGKFLLLFRDISLKKIRTIVPRPNFSRNKNVIFNQNGNVRTDISLAFQQIRIKSSPAELWTSHYIYTESFYFYT